jgi:RHS repeat-associated protein/uncharacterized repeat protein (TIGR01451 family)
LRAAFAAAPAGRLHMSNSAGVVMKLGLQRWCAIAAGALMVASGLAQAQVQRTFVNLGFELPSAAPSTCFFQVSEALVPGWTTNHPSQNGTGCAPNVAQTPGPLIEIWRSGFSSVNARSGSQFAELNAEAAARIFQNVCLANGELVGWRFSHRGRQSGTTDDVTEFRVGSTPNTHRVVRAGTQNDGGGGVQTCYGTTSAGDGGVRDNSCTTATASNGWRDYSGNFTWQGTTGTQAIGFEAISAAGGATIGNFIDDIQMTLRPFVELTTATAAVREGATEGWPALRVVGTVPAGGISVQLAISGGTAVRGVDYSTASGTDTLTVTVPAGVYDGNDIALPLSLIDDSVIEDNETIALAITSSPTNYVLSSTQTCGGTAITSTQIQLRDNDIDLSSSLTVPVSSALGGEVVVYTYIVRNYTARPTTGDATSHDAALPVSLAPATGLTFGSWTCTASGGAQCPGGTVNGTANGSGPLSGTVQLPAGNAAAGGSVSYAITAQLSPTRCTAVTQNASLAAPAGLAEGNSVQSGFVSPAPGGSSDNNAGHTLSVSCLAPLSISKTDNASHYTAGGTATYVIDIGNTGPSTATALAVSDSLPDGLTLSAAPTCTAEGSASCGSVSGSSGGTSAGLSGATLPPGSGNTLRLSVPVNVAAGLQVASLVNLASASSAVSPMVTASDSSARPNQAPVAEPASISVTGNGSAQITLQASDADNDPLTFHIVTPPAHGSLSGTAPALTYTPSPGYSGSDSFSFRASDGVLDSATVSVSVTVTAPINRAPVITSPAVTAATPVTPYRYDVVASDPDAGDSLTYTLPLAPSGMLIDPASGRVDWQAGASLAEGVEAPNLQCRAAPAQDPTIQAWPISVAVAWQRSPSVIHTPLVGRVVDTNADGRLDAADHPTVIVLQDNRVVARDGVNGNLLWQSAGADFGTWGATPALGDTDGDGWPEIYAYTSTRAVASLSAQGSERWRSVALLSSTTNAALGLADLDGDGSAEVLAGNHVLASQNGAIRWSDSAAYNYASPIAVDLDGNGTQEVLMGSRVLNANGTLRWQLTHPSVVTAYNYVRWGVGNLDADAAPELVAIYNAQVLVLDADGTIKPGFPKTFEGERNLSNPALGDLDGDGRLEIVMATNLSLRALRADGSVLWETLSDDDSAMATPSLFDFDGDNRDEVVFAGHGSVRILDGRSGAQRLKHTINSVTWLESVTIADADGNGRADLLFGDQAQLTVLRDAQDQWVSTRPWWNQHAYQMAGIDDAGRIPAQPAWHPAQRFRGNGVPAGHPLGQPDLAAFALATVEDSSGTRLVVRVRNRGLAPSAASSVRFYSGEVLLGETAVPALAVNAAQEIELALAPGSVLDSLLAARVDEAGTVAECAEDNNTARAVRVTVQASDLAGLSDRQTFLVTTRADNQAPQWITTGLPAVRVGASYAAPVQAQDADIGDAVRYSAVSVPAGSGVDDLLGRFVWTPTPDQVGEHTVILRATDLAGATAQRSLAIQVLPNALPVVSALPPGSAIAGQPYAGTLAAQDADGDVLRYTLNRGPSGLSLDAAGEVRWTPTLAQTGQQLVRATISDDHGGATQVEWLIRVERLGQAPVFTSTPVTLGSAGREYRYAVTASDADGDVLTFSLVAPPPGMVVDAGSGLVRWPSAWAGSWPVTVRVSDGRGYTIDQRYALEVRAAGSANRAPQFSTMPPLQARVGRAYRYASQARDPDGDAVSYSLVQAPPGMTLDAAGELAWVPQASGSAAVTLRAADASQYTEQGWQIDTLPADAPLDVTVTLLPSAPRPGTPWQVQVSTREPGPLQVSATLDGQPVSLALGTTTLNAPLTPGRHELTVSLSDGVAVGTQTVVFGVVDPADQQAPVVVLSAPLGGSRITAPADVHGSVSDAQLLDWFLAVRPANSPAVPVTVIARGSAPVSDALLGVFDPTLLINGQYELILEARDASGRTSVTSTVVRVEGEMKVGHFSLTFEDVNLPVAGLPIRVTRTYDTRRRQQALDFGQGWSLDTQNVIVSESHRTGMGWQLQVSGSGVNRQFCVRSASPRRVSVTLPDGQVESFVAKAQPECATLTPYAAFVNLVYVAEAGTTATLTQQSFGSLRVSSIAGEPAEHLIDPGDASLAADPNRYRLTTREGLVYDIDQTSGVSVIKEPGGNTLTYSATGITHSSGQAVRFVRDGRNRVQRIVLPDGTERRYDYSHDGDLLASYDALQQPTRYTYLSNRPHYLEALHDARGVGVQRNEYDDEGRLVAAIDADGRRISYEHVIAERRETFTNRRGHSSTYLYDEEGRVLAQTNPLQNTLRHTYDADGNELTRTDALDHATTWTYDAYGNRLSEKNALNQTQRWEYNARNAVTRQFSAVDPARAVLTNTYDATWFELRSSQDALGQVTTLSYDRGSPSWNTGELRKIIDPSGALTEFYINPRGWMTDQFDALGTRTRYTHDANGRVLSQSIQRSVAGAPAVTQVTSYVYDAQGRVTSTTHPDGSISTTTYNAIDKPEQECVQLRCTTFTYDNQGRLTRTTYPNDTWEAKAYDENGNVIAETDAEGRTTKFVFDAADQLIETIFPDDTPGTDADNPRRRNVYDDAGQLEMAIDENDNFTSYGYDAAGRQTSVTNALNQTTTTQYDADGRRTAVTDAAGRTTKFVYDLAGRLIETIHPDAGNDDGNDANNPRTAVEYDKVGRKIAERDEAGRITRFAYDKVGRLVAVFLPDPATGNNPPLNVVTGNEAPTSPNSAVLVTRYAYDELGNKLTQVTPSCSTGNGGSGGDGCAASAATGVVTAWSYDNAGRVLTRTLPLGQIETFQYDGFGRRSQHTDFRGRMTAYSYHPDTDWLATIDYASQADVSLQYTQGGQLREVQDGNGTTTYTRDVRGRLTQVTWPQRPGMATAPTISYQYDAAGNRTRLTTPNQVLDYSFDELNRLAAVTPQGAVTPIAAYTYDNVGNRATLSHDNGTTASYSYNRRNRLTGIQHKAGAALLLGVAYTLDPSGLRTGIEETGAINRQVSYTYDAVKRLTNESVIAASGDRRTSWVYDKTGNRLTQVQHIGPLGAETGTATTAYIYDVNDRLATETTTLSGSVPGATAGQTIYTYDAAGNTTRKAAPAETVDYVYDDANRLAELQTLAGEVTRYAYNHDGIRLSQTRDATGPGAATTHYLIDPNQAYAQVIEESAQQGSSSPSLIALYAFGDDRIRQARLANGSVPAGLRYYHADGLGSTRLLTDDNSSVTDHYAYHAFGEVDTAASLQSSDNSFLFAGEQLDPNSGFYYLRARYMNPANGRFTQQDSWQGATNDPLTLHKYVYASASPVSYLDPTGNYAILSIVDFGFSFGASGVMRTTSAGAARNQFMRILFGHPPGDLGIVGEFILENAVSALVSNLGVSFSTKQVMGSKVHKDLELSIKGFKPIAGIEVIPEVFFDANGNEQFTRGQGTLGIDILIKRNGVNVMGIDLKIGAGFPGKKRREISRRAGNIPIIQIYMGVKGK